MATSVQPTPTAPDAPAHPAATEQPTPGTELGYTPGGATIKASGVDPNQPAEALDFKAAGRAALAKMQQGDRTVAEEIAASVKAGQQAPAQSESAADDDDADGSAGELTWDETAQRWRDPQGQFVNAEPPTPEEIAAAGGAKPDAAADESPLVKITLPGLAERGEADIEAEVDPDLAERIQRLRNDGMRRRAFDDAMQTVEAQRAELDAVTQALVHDPVGFTLNQMTPERQLEVARALVLEHFDALLPDLQAYAQDPATRQSGRVELRDRLRESSQQLTEVQARQQHAASCMRAAQSLLPETVDQATVSLFLADAEQDLIRAARAGRPVTPETVPQLLASRLQLYGFASDAVAQPGGAAPSSPPAPESARPVSDRAKAIAERKQAASEAQHRIRRVQTARRSAASIAPPGVGAATVQVPVIPPDADIHTASKILRKRDLSGWTQTSQ